MQVHSSFLAGFTYSSSLISTETHNSVVASWNADQKDAGSNLLSFILYFFISNQKDMGSNPVYSKSRVGHAFFSKECNVLAFFCVLYKIMRHSLRSL